MSESEGVFDVLVVDDHPVFRETLVKGLRSRPEVRSVNWADNGASAVALATKFRLDVVLMDLGMPGMDGLEATRKIVAQRPRSAVIMMSMNDAPEVAAKAKAAGAKDYMVKGLDLEGIMEVIWRAVHGVRPDGGPRGRINGPLDRPAA